MDFMTEHGYIEVGRDCGRWGAVSDGAGGVRGRRSNSGRGRNAKQAAGFS